MEQHLIDYVWMALPGGQPIKIITAGDEVSRRMFEGYRQIDPPKAESPVLLTDDKAVK